MARFGVNLPDLGGVCHGTHSGEGPVLAILAMLARRRRRSPLPCLVCGALCVAPGGSAPPIPSAPFRGLLTPGRDEKAGSPVEPE